MICLRCSERSLRPGTSALEEGFGFCDLQNAIRRRDVTRLKALWNDIVRRWDDHSFYEFVATSVVFSRLSFRHREVFGQVGFGTGGWESDFANTMLEILRVVITTCDSDQHLIRGGAERVPRRLWEFEAGPDSRWPEGTSLRSLHPGANSFGGEVAAASADGEEILTADLHRTTLDDARRNLTYLADRRLDLYGKDSSDR